MTFKKNNICLGVALATITMAGALVSPQALARSSAESAAEAANRKAEILESQLRAMQDEIAALRAQVNNVAPTTAVDSQKVQELDAWMTSVKSQPVETHDHHDNTLFFRGGYSHQNNDRGGTLDPTYIPGIGSNPDGLTVGSITDKDGWYFGAGFDFGLTDDIWGMMDNTQVLAELNLDYTELGTNKNNGLSGQETAVVNTVLNSVNGTTGVLYTPPANSQEATVNMLRISASPKIKFLKDKPFRPWLLPVGFELSIISPPSDAITVLTPGMVFGAGADYRIWKDIFIGADARYHYAPGDVDGVNVNGVTAGGYIGIGF